jgi:beta-1,4-mannosyltransferase
MDSSATPAPASPLSPPLLYVYPGSDNLTPYMARNRSLWSRLGYRLKDFPADLFGAGAGTRRERVALFNWYEDWMFQNARPAGLSLAWAALWICLARWRCGRIVWVRHNFKPHLAATSSFSRKLLMRMMGRVCDVVVTHRPLPDASSKVVPHPLPERPASLDHTRRDIPFLWFGAVERYKGLETLLAVWPRTCKLQIVGRCRDAHLAQALRSIIIQRGLDATWDDRRVSDRELDDLLLRSRWVVMAHTDDAMIVSGTAYHAMGLGANLLALDSEFSRHLAERHAFVTLFREGDLEGALADLEAMDPCAVREQAESYYGDAACLNAWQEVLRVHRE